MSPAQWSAEKEVVVTPTLETTSCVEDVQGERYMYIYTIYSLDQACKMARHEDLPTSGCSMWF